MPNAFALIEHIQNGRYDRLFSRMYPGEQMAAQRSRYIAAVKAFVETYGDRDNLALFSAPGRTEIGGNHTDHNHGRVLAASVNLDVIAVAAPSAEPVVRVQSAGYPMDTVALDDLAVHTEEINHSASLIRGMASRLQQLDWAIGGFDAYTPSNVLKGSGLSSSAAFEVLIGTVFSHLYNDGKVSAVEIAKMAQYAENIYFGKPSGLMDQMASSVGGIITIDFADSEKPDIRTVPFDFAASGYRLCIVDTGGNHADLTYEYASIPADMKGVAEALGKSFLREITMEQLLPAIPMLREKLGDRAVLRAMHFLQDNDRVARQVEALSRQDFEEFRRMVIDSGHSSFEYLQNIYSTSDVQSQGLSLALCLAQMELEGCGAWRVHGGGFGGTTQNFVPEDRLDAFRSRMEGVFGAGSCHVLSIRPFGGICLDQME